MGPKSLDRTYALWLMPEGDTYRRLDQRIRQLCREHSSPVFAPHVTLASHIVGPRREVLARSRELAARLRPLILRLGRIEGRGEYFRCLFARVTKSPELARANRLAMRIFDLRKQRPFKPHLSLVYGKLAPRAKKRIAASLGKSCALEFAARRIHLVSIQGPPSRWRRITSYPLAKEGTEKAASS